MSPARHLRPVFAGAVRARARAPQRFSSGTIYPSAAAGKGAVRHAHLPLPVAAVAFFTS